MAVAVAVAVAVAEEAGDVVLSLIVNSSSKRSTSDDHPAKVRKGVSRDARTSFFSAGMPTVVALLCCCRDAVTVASTSPLTAWLKQCHPACNKHSTVRVNEHERSTNNNNNIAIRTSSGAAKGELITANRERLPVLAAAAAGRAASRAQFWVARTTTEFITQSTQTSRPDSSKTRPFYKARTISTREMHAN